MNWIISSLATMGVLHELHLELQGDNNETYIGKIVIEAGEVPTANVSDTASSGEDDPMGAGSYVIAVVLIYGLSIVFLIASHVMLKRRELHRDNEKQITKFLEAAPSLKEKSAKDSYKSLKKSIIPVVALSPARDLVARRKSFAPLIHGLFPPNYHHHNHIKPSSSSDDLHEKETPSDGNRVSPSETASCRMSIIVEESDVDLERSLNAALLGQRLKIVQQDSPENNTSDTETSTEDDATKVSDQSTPSKPAFKQPHPCIDKVSEPELRSHPTIMTQPQMAKTTQCFPGQPQVVSTVSTSQSFPPPPERVHSRRTKSFPRHDMPIPGTANLSSSDQPRVHGVANRRSTSPSRYKSSPVSTTPLLSCPSDSHINLTPHSLENTVSFREPDNHLSRLPSTLSTEREDLMHVTCL